MLKDFVWKRIEANHSPPQCLNNWINGDYNTIAFLPFTKYTPCWKPSSVVMPDSISTVRNKRPSMV